MKFSSTISLSACLLMLALSETSIASGNIIRTPAPVLAVDKGPAPELPDPDPEVKPPLELSLAEYTLPYGIVGDAYSFSFLTLANWKNLEAGVSAPTLNWSTQNGIQNGLSLTSLGSLQGTPTEGGTSLFEVNAQYAAGQASKQYSLRVYNPEVELSEQSLPTAEPGKPYSFDFSSLASWKDTPPGYTTPQITWEQVDAPEGFTLSPAGVLTGITYTEGEAPVDIKVRHDKGEAQKTYTLIIEGVPLNAFQIATGQSHTCALLVDKTVKCWGAGNSGQLGDGLKTNSPSPVAVTGLTGVKYIGAGMSHTCALTDTNAVKCWGNNTYGQLGIGSSTAQSVPANVVASGVTSLAVGGYHTCLTKTDGKAYCMGDNGQGRLGDGTQTDRSVPTPVTGITNVNAVYIGRYHSCAVLADATAKCWGSNQYGQLGTGVANTQIITPATVTGLSNVKSMTVGVYHACAVSYQGQAHCWGLNNQGALGDGTLINKYYPVPVSGLANVIQVAAGDQFSCSLQSNGDVKCWGSNGGKLGIGSVGTQVTPPTTLTASGASYVSTGYDHGCAAAGYNGIKCWGSNTSGQLGDGTTTTRNIPVDVGF